MSSLSDQQKEIIRQIYDEVAKDYDHPANFFSQAVAEPMLSHIDLAAESKLLDAGTGTGVFALYAAEQVPNSQVIGIDLSAVMLEQARQKAQRLELDNVRFQQMDMEALNFPNYYFDAITFCFSFYFLENIAESIKRISVKIKPHGKIAISFYQPEAFLPLSSLFKQHYMLFRPQNISPEPWEQLSEAAFIESIYSQAGINNISIHHEPLGFQLTSPKTWWDILWNTGYRRLLNQLSVTEQAAFKQKHLAEIAKLCEINPYWVDTSIIIVVGSNSVTASL